MVANGRAADAVAEVLEAEIAAGTLPADMPLPAERDLITRFGTSRTVVRQAISTLASRGLIESKPRFRPIVRKPDYAAALHAVSGVVRHLLGDTSGVKNLYDSRLFIERALVRDAAVSASRQDIADLKQALAENQAAIPDSLAFYRTDVAFHGVLYRVPRNPIFLAIHEGYTSWLEPHWSRMERSPERNTSNYRAHAAILDAILERDPAKAEDALVVHLDAAWEHVRGTFEETGR